MTGLHNEEYDRIEALETENERLRAALEAVADSDRIMEARAIAQRALTAAKGS